MADFGAEDRGFEVEKRGRGRPRKLNLGGSFNALGEADEDERLRDNERMDRDEVGEIQRQRRRKTPAGINGKRLAVSESSLDFNRYAYRWVNDTPARIFSKTKEDDWDIVRKDGRMIDDSSDLGNAVSHIVGRNPDGSPMVAYLCRKPRGYFDDDQRDKLADLDRQLEQMRVGNNADGSSQSDYVRDGAIRL